MAGAALVATIWGLAAVMGFVAVLGTCLWHGVRVHRARQSVVAGYAASRGWTLVAADHRWTALAEGEPFGVGYYRRAEKILIGPWRGYMVTVFDYRFTVGWGKGTRTRRKSACAVALPASLPSVHIRPEGVGDGVARLVGGQDFDVESEDFNRAYRVQSADPRFASALLNPRTVEHLLAAGPIVVEVCGRNIVSTTDGRVDLRAIDARLALLTGMCERLPRYVWSDRGVLPPPVPGAGSPS